MLGSDLRDRVAFEQRSVASDGYGNVMGEFAEEFEKPARIRPLLGGEEVMAARLTGRQPARITVRQSARTREITTDWRARNVRNGVVYNIRSIVDPYEHTAERRRWLDLLCDAGVAT